jgi:predicted transcriptional regulator
MPALPMDVDTHVAGVHSIHRIMDAIKQRDNPRTVQQWRDLIHESYTDFAQRTHPDMRPVIHEVRDRALEWLSSPEVGLP